MPTDRDITELLGFLPRLTAPGFEPVRQWHGGSQDDGTFEIPWPDYDPVVEELVKAASRECWRDHDYHPTTAGRMLEDHELVASADLDQIRTMLTYCLRGERFCDGHWEAVIKAGHIERLLRRVGELRDAGVIGR